MTLGQFYKETTAGGTKLPQVDNLMHHTSEHVCCPDILQTAGTNNEVADFKNLWHVSAINNKHRVLCEGGT